MSDRRYHRLLWTLLFLLAAPAAAGADILIGTAGPMQGQYAAFGEQMRRGAEMAVAGINAAGGVNGEKLVLEIGDDACDPKQAVAVAERMVAKGIKLMAGHFCSGASIAAAKIYEAAGIPQISPASTHPKFTEEGEWNVARVVGRDDAQGTAAGKYLAGAYKDRKIAVLDDNSPYGKLLADAVRKALNAGGVTEAFNESYAPGEKDYTALVSRLKDVEAVYIGGNHTEAALILRQMREQGLAAQLVAGDALVTDEFWTIAGAAGEGALATFAPDPRKFPAAKEVVEKFTVAGYNPEGHTLHAHAAIQAWAQGAAATGGTDGRKIAEWLRAGNRLNTVLGDMTLDARGDVKDPPIAWYRWSGGKYAVDDSIR